LLELKIHQSDSNFKSHRIKKKKAFSQNKCFKKAVVPVYLLHLGDY